VLVHHPRPRIQRRTRVRSSCAITARATDERITTSPPCQEISSLEVASTRVSCPVSGSTFADSAVRVLEWIKPAGAGVGGIGRLAVFMPCSLPSGAMEVTANKSPLLARSLA